MSVLRIHEPAGLLLAAVLPLLAGASCERRPDSAAGVPLTFYFYVQETSGQKGGMPTQLKTIYVSADGEGQLSEETTDDAVVKLSTSTVRPRQFFDNLSRVNFPKRSDGTGERAVDLVTEYSPPSILVEALDAHGSVRSWQGDPKRVPAEIAAAVEKARQLIKSGSGFALHQGSRYIRATVLTPSAAQDMKEAGILKPITASDLDNAPLVRRAVTHPRMLVCVDAAQNPYGGLGTFSQGRSLAFGIDRLAFQIRNLEKPNPPQTRKEKTGG